MVSGLCPGYNPTMTPLASPSRKLHIDPAKDYSSPLKVETSVEYDLPAHIYPPKGSEPILMIHPGFVSAVPRARSRAVITPTPTAMVATSGAIRPLQQKQVPLTNSLSRTVSRTPRSRCPCGNPKCNSSSAKTVSAQGVRNVQNNHSQSVANITNGHSFKSISSRDKIVLGSSGRNSAVILDKSAQEIGDTVIVAPPQLDRNNVLRLQQPSNVTGGTSATASTTNTSQPFAWGAGGRCRGACCNPRPAAIAPTPTEFVAPDLPPSLLTRTPTRGTSPKIKGARSRRGLSVTSSVHLPDYMAMGTSRSARVTGAATTAQSRMPRVTSTFMGGALIATPAPPMAHQNMPTSLEPERSQNFTPKSSFPTQQQLQANRLQSKIMDLTSSLGTSLAHSVISAQISSNASSPSSLLTRVVDLSRDSGCSTGGDYPLDWTSDRTRGLVDSGFCTPVDKTASHDCAKDTFDMSGWRASPTPFTPVIGSVPTSSSLLSRTTTHHQYLPQPAWIY